MKFKKADISTEKLLLKTLKRNVISIFHLNAKKLPEEDKNLLQEIYITAIGILNFRSENLYNLLLFNDSFVEYVDAVISDFLVEKSHKSSV